MKRRDLILALLVVIVWGANFTVIKLGLAGLPPMLLVALRYTFAAVPAIFFVNVLILVGNILLLMAWL